VHIEGEQLGQEIFELVGRDESGCVWRKRKTFEDIAKEREREQQNSGVKSKNSREKILSKPMWRCLPQNPPFFVFEC
jgi:hypothetical protein